ncbi:VTT domain-containing protein [Olivibacter sp. CPCC 100613]|uniref:DedA family protein n=1 Tax=Olivibacter sp. CPCC 100613 TaxID=3079931 RepID=UPI002FFA5F2C
MTEIFDFFQNLTNPEWIMENGGLYLLLFIVFAETGILLGFFLPGDPLLFITGMILANNTLPTVDPVWSLLYWILLISIAGILGNFLGYWTGKRSGSVLLKRKDNLLFKKKYIVQAQEFYEKKGGGAIILARFMPIVRTFAPIVAGIVKMDLRKFSIFNIAGSFIWVGVLVTAGYLLGENEWIKNNLEKIIFLIVLIATAPVLIKMLKGLRNKSLEKNAS